MLSTVCVVQPHRPRGVTTALVLSTVCVLDLTRSLCQTGAAILFAMLTPRWATAGVFFVNGAGVGTLLPQLPFVKDRLDITKGVLGLCLLAMTLGALVAMPIAGQVVNRRASRRVVRVAIAAYPVALAIPLLAPTPLALAALLCVVGTANGAVDVAQNAHGAALERDLGRSVMSSLHAGWSVGGVAGAGGAALAAAAGLDPRAYMAIAAGALLAVGVAVSGRIGDAAVADEQPHAGIALPPPGVILLGVLCIMVMVAEGAMNDWSAIYLREDLGTGAAVSATGFAAFSAGMAVGRAGGDALVGRLGAGMVLRGGAALAAIALGGLLAADAPAAAVPGMALVGLGVANGVPLLFSAAGRTSTPGPAIAAVSTMGYVAFLGGPPFLGFLADALGLPGALASVCVALGVVAVSGASLSPRRSR